MNSQDLSCCSDNCFSSTVARVLIRLLLLRPQRRSRIGRGRARSPASTRRSRARAGRAAPCRRTTPDRSAARRPADSAPACRCRAASTSPITPADHAERAGLLQHHRPHVAVRRAERHADRDLARALRDQERHQSVEPERGEEDADRADAARDPRRELLRQQSERRRIVERLQHDDRHVRFDLRHRRPDRPARLARPARAGCRTRAGWSGAAPSAHR